MISDFRATTAAGALWAIWFIGWLITASWSAKTVARISGTSQLSYSLFTWAGAILLFLHPRSLSGLLQPLLPTATRLPWVGVALIAIGLGFSGWARSHLGRLWSGRVTLKEDHTIIQTGPYSFVRHPIYTGLLVAVVGTLLTEITLAAIAGAVVLTIGLIMKIRQEERLLTNHFGAAYDDYRIQVAGLIPYVW